MSEWVAAAHLGDDLVARRLSSRPIERPWRIAYRRDHADTAQLLARGLEGAAPRIYAAARARR